MEKKRYKRELNSQGEGQRKRDSVKESCLGPCNKHSVSSSGLDPEICGGLAQLGERLLCKQEVSGSIPLISTMRASSSAG